MHTKINNIMTFNHKIIKILLKSNDGGMGVVVLLAHICLMLGHHPCFCVRILTAHILALLSASESLIQLELVPLCPSKLAGSQLEHGSMAAAGSLCRSNWSWFHCVLKHHRQVLFELPSVTWVLTKLTCFYKATSKLVHPSLKRIISFWSQNEQI